MAGRHMQGGLPIHLHDAVIGLKMALHSSWMVVAVGGGWTRIGGRETNGRLSQTLLNNFLAGCNTKLFVHPQTSDNAEKAHRPGKRAPHSNRRWHRFRSKSSASDRWPVSAPSSHQSLVDCSRWSHLKHRFITKVTKCVHCTLTLRSNEDQWNLRSIAIVGHFRVVVVNCTEWWLVLQAEDENDCIHPSCKLDRKICYKNTNNKPRQHKTPSLSC